MAERPERCKRVVTRAYFKSLNRRALASCAPRAWTRDARLAFVPFGAARSRALRAASRLGPSLVLNLGGCRWRGAGAARIRGLGMEWSDTGIVLSARRHGENAAVVSLLTEHRGRHAGLVHGARGRRARGLYQPGNTLAARWQARLPEHLGRYTCELERARASVLLDDPPRLAALAALCALTEATLPERHPYPQVYGDTLRLLDALEAGERWAEAVVRWELALLAELGFGLDLSACAATGEVEGLVYVSPRSGRAVSREAGAPYAGKLLALPPFLAGVEDGPASADDIVAGLRLTGWFLEKHVFAGQGGRMPSARERFIDRLQAGAES